MTPVKLILYVIAFCLLSIPQAFAAGDLTIAQGAGGGDLTISQSTSGDPVLIDGTEVSDSSGVDLQGGADITITFDAGASPDTASFAVDDSFIQNDTDDTMAGDLTITGNLFVNNDVDQVALTVQGHSTQTNAIFTVENSGATDQFTVSATGIVTGVLVSVSTALQVGSDYLTDITGPGLDIPGNVLQASSAVRDRTSGFFCGGTLSTDEDCEEGRARIPSDCVSQRVDLAVTTAPTVTGSIVSPLDCSAPNSCFPIFTSDNRPRIAASAFSGNITTTGIVVTAGNFIGWDIDQIGGTVVGSDLTGTMTCRF